MKILWFVLVTILMVTNLIANNPINILYTSILIGIVSKKTYPNLLPSIDPEIKSTLIIYGSLKGVMVSFYLFSVGLFLMVSLIAGLYYGLEPDADYILIARILGLTLSVSIVLFLAARDTHKKYDAIRPLVSRLKIKDDQVEWEPEQDDLDQRDEEQPHPEQFQAGFR